MMCSEGHVSGWLAHLRREGWSTTLVGQAAVHLANDWLDLVAEIDRLQLLLMDAEHEIVKAHRSIARIRTLAPVRR